MPTNRLKSLLLAGVAAACVSGLTSPAHATVIAGPPEFELFESSNCIGIGCTGTFTVVNNSNLGFFTPTTIIGFAVQTPSASLLNPHAFTTQTDWTATVLSTCLAGSFCGNAFAYLDTSLFDSGAFDGTPVLANDIGPGTTDSNFTFAAGLALASPAELFLSNGQTLDIAAVDLPEPSTDAMLGIGLFGLAFALGRRRKT
jgi:hypothetical protein